MAKKIEWVIKQGNFEKKRFGAKQPGLDITRVVGDILKDKSLAVTNDCCTYYPTVPALTVVDHDAPTETEMEDVPLWGIFRATDGTDSAIHIKIASDTTISLGTTT